MTNITSLLSEDVRELNVDTESAQSLVTLLSIGDDSVIDTPQFVNSGFQPELQLEGKWCWAAVGSMISSYYWNGVGREWKQCDIASENTRLPAGTNCCVNPMDEICDQAYLLSETLKIVERLHKFENHGFDHKSSSRIFDEVVNVGNLVPIRIQREDGSGHFYIICGYWEEEDVFALWDPAGEWELESAESFESDFGGQWTHTYFLA
jgi:hypothetical protein